MRKPQAFLTAILLFSFLAWPAQSKPPVTSNDLSGLYLKEGDSLQHDNNILYGEKDGTMGVLCESLTDSNCITQSGDRLRVTALLLPCSNEVTLACIEEVFVRDKNGEKYPAKFNRVIASKLNYATSAFAEDLTNGFVAGAGVGNLWTVSGISGFDSPLKLVVQASLKGWRQLSNNGTSGNKYFWSYYSMELGVANIKETTGRYRLNGLDFEPESKRMIGGDTIGSNGRGDDHCVATEVGLCFERISYPQDLRVGVTLRLSQAMRGFFHGRINSPTINQTTNSNNVTALSVEASPVTVPYIRERVTSDKWGANLVDFVNAHYATLCGGSSEGLMIPGTSGDCAFEIVSRFLPVIKDKATGSSDFWSIRTLDGYQTKSEYDQVNKCLSSSSVSGFVSTNAMVYSAGPPTFNASTGALDYKVLSPHYNSVGVDNLGTYDLLLKSDFARCIYGFSSAPVRAEISIVGASGEEKVATTVINEKDGWMYLSAKGFTFSSPTIRVKISQEKEVESPPAKVEATAPSTQTTTTLIPAPAAKKTITCIKGKTTKKVTGSNPKCPVGWKKR